MMLLVKVLYALISAILDQCVSKTHGSAPPVADSLYANKFVLQPYISLRILPGHTLKFPQKLNPKCLDKSVSHSAFTTWNTPPLVAVRNIAAGNIHSLKKRPNKHLVGVRL